MAERPFPIETVLSCVALYKIEDNIPMMACVTDIADLIAFMDNTSPLPFLINPLELIIGASICGLILIKQHAVLGEITYPYVEYCTQPEHFAPWIASVYSSIGSEVIVQSVEDLELTEAECTLLDEVHRTLKGALIFEKVVSQNSDTANACSCLLYSSFSP